MDVLLTLNSLNSSYRAELHLTFPEELPPYHTTKILVPGKTYAFKLNDNGCIFAVVHFYTGAKLAHRIVFQPNLNFASSIAMNAISFDYEINLKKASGEDVAFRACNVDEIHQSLYNHIEKNYNLVMNMNPEAEVIRRKHSLKYEIEMEGKSLYVPYVTLCTRGYVALQNISIKRLESYQDFFRKSLNNYIHNVTGRVPTDFVRQSQVAYKENDSSRQHSLMIQIADYFSHLMHSRIQYTTDYNATGKNDYVGMNVIDGVMAADCEDIASAAYDTMRIFRKIFPATMADIDNPSTTLPYHVSAWLNRSKIMLCQGSVLPNRNEQQINHVWAALLLDADVPMVVVEGTRDSVDYSKYKYLIRAWMMDGSNIYDYFMVNPHRNTYGLSMSDLVYEKNARHVFFEWAKNMLTDNKTMRAIMFAGSIQTETHTFMDRVLKK